MSDEVLKPEIEDESIVLVRMVDDDGNEIDNSKNNPDLLIMLKFHKPMRGQEDKLQCPITITKSQYEEYLESDVSDDEIIEFCENRANVQKSIEGNDEKELSDEEKEQQLKEQIEDVDIDWDIIEFDDEEKHYPSLTEEQMELFCDISDTVIDRNFIMQMYHNAKEQVTATLAQLADPLEFDTEEEAEQDRKETMDLYESSRKVMAYAQYVSKDISSMFEKECYLELQVRDISIRGLYDYLFTRDRLNNGSINDEEAEVLASTFKDRAEKSGMWLGSVMKSIDNIDRYYNNEYNNIFSEYFLEKRIDATMNCIKTTVKRSNVNENIDIKKISDSFTNEYMLFGNFGTFVNIITNNIPKPESMSDEDFDKLVESYKNQYDKDGSIQKSIADGSEFKTYIDTIETQQKTIVESFKDNPEYLKNIYNNILLSVENDKLIKSFMRKYRDGTYCNIIDIMNDSVIWEDASKSFIEFLDIEHSNITDWGRHNDAIEKINTLFITNVTCKDPTESNISSLCNLFINKFINYITNSLFVEVRDSISDMNINKTYIEYCTDFLTNLFNLNRTLMVKCDSETTCEKFIKDNKIFDRFRIKPSEPKEGEEKVEKPDFLFDYLDVMDMKRTLVEIIIKVNELVITKFIPGLSTSTTIDMTPKNNKSKASKRRRHNNIRR